MEKIIKSKITENVCMVCLGIIFLQQMSTTTLLDCDIYFDVIYIVSQLAFTFIELLLILRFFNELLLLRNKKITSVNECKDALSVSATFLLFIITNILLTNLGVDKEGESMLIILCLSFAFVGIDYKKILRIVFRIGVALIAIMFILSMLGLVDNNRGNSFGFIYRTDYACHWLFLLLIYCFYYAGELSAAGQIGIFVATIINFAFIKGKTACICMLVVIYVTYYKHYCKLNKIPYPEDSSLPIKWLFKVIYAPVVLISYGLNYLNANFKQRMLNVIRFCIKYSFVIFAMFMIALTMVYAYIPTKIYSKIPKLSSIRARLRLGILGFEQYGVNLTGNMIPQQGAGGREGLSVFYYYLDSSYIRLILQYGVIILLMIIGIMTFIQLRLHKASMYYEMFILSIVALDCAIEHHIANVSYNTFMLLMFASLSVLDEEDKGILSVKASDADKKIPPHKNTVIGTTKRHPIYRILKYICGVTTAIILALAIISAYKISTFSGWTPTSNATLVLTGSQIDKNLSDDSFSRKADACIDYLKKHDSSVCLIYANEAESLRLYEYIKAQEIDLSRVFVCDDATSDYEQNDLEKVLIKAKQYIEEKCLPKRMTICEYGMHQARVAYVAHKISIPVNSLEVNINPTIYLQNYILEQIRLTATLIIGVVHI